MISIGKSSDCFIVVASAAARVTFLSCILPQNRLAGKKRHKQR
jgi:hypothetical protein